MPTQGKNTKHRANFLSRVKSTKGFLVLSLGVLLIGAFITGVYFSYAKHTIDQRFEQLHSARSSQFYALFPSLEPGQTFELHQLQLELEQQGFNEKKSADDLVANEYAWVPSAEGKKLTIHRPTFDRPGRNIERLRAGILFEVEGRQLKLKSITQEDRNTPLERFEFPPKKISSFYAGRVRTQSPVTLSDIPVNIRYAVMAIEDINFLEHSGVSARSTLRALFRDLKAKRFVEGGSTITQQLMKNLFFSREKALSRKIREALYAFITETTHSKEAILEAYLNEVYMGQWSTHEIHGVSEGARFYFNRPISELSLSQSATLAAIIQAPNNHDPRRFPDNTLKRRNLVLKRMLEGNFILKDEYELAITEGLNVVPAEKSLQDIGYFMDLVLSQMPEELKTRLDTDALTIYTTLNPYLQVSASVSLKQNILRLEKNYPSIKKKAAKGIHLQSALIAVDVPTGNVIALQGGSSYQKTQFNRVLQGRRQPGSLFKPFVFLTAFDKPAPENPINPLTQLDGKAFEWKYEGQTWKPKNYEPEYPESVTARLALEHSLNVPTAHLAQTIGIGSIVEMLKKAGIRSEIPAVPSIALGSAEVSPLELAEVFTTLANLGKGGKLRGFVDIYDEKNNLLIENRNVQEEKLPPVATFLTLQLLKGVFTNGTARSALASGIPLANFAGKTGTTNEYKDAWFVGFSPKLLTLVWVGYDEEEKVGLTGAAAALPLWAEFIKTAGPYLNEADFIAPEGVLPFDIDPASNLLATNHCPNKYTEYFRPGTQPQNQCNLHP